MNLVLYSSNNLNAVTFCRLNHKTMIAFFNTYRCATRVSRVPRNTKIKTWITLTRWKHCDLEKPKRTLLPKKHDVTTTPSLSSKFLEVCILTFDIIVLFGRLLFGIIYGIFELFIPPKEQSVSGEIVLITGTGHGIGKELAKQYGELGAQVVCVDVNEETNNATVAELKKLGIAAHAFTCDVCSREKVLELRDKVQSEVGDVSILVNNAGIMPCKRFLSHTPEVIKKMFDVNVFAHFWMLEAFLPTMMKNDKGHIVGISSIAGLVGSPNVAPYSGSKFAVAGLMEALSEEIRTLTNHNIYFTTIYPYITDTGLCKKPNIRFKNFMRILPPSETASVIIQTQRRRYKEATAPKYLLYMNNATKILPTPCVHLIKDFLGSKLDEHD